MNTRLIGQGFIKKVVERSGCVFVDVVVSAGKSNVYYSCLLDSKFSDELRQTADVFVIVDAMKNTPVVVSIDNPFSEIKNGYLKNTGILKGWVDLDVYKARLHDADIFSA